MPPAEEAERSQMSDRRCRCPVRFSAPYLQPCRSTSFPGAFTPGARPAAGCAASPVNRGQLPNAPLGNSSQPVPRSSVASIFHPFPTHACTCGRAQAAAASPLSSGTGRDPHSPFLQAGARRWRLAAEAMLGGREIAAGPGRAARCRPPPRHC